MKTKKKAIELVNKYLQIYDGRVIEAKKCALIAVDEAIEVCPYLSKEYCDTSEQMRAYDIQFVSYWEEVKHEILKL